MKIYFKLLCKIALVIYFIAIIKGMFTSILNAMTWAEFLNI